MRLKLTLVIVLLVLTAVPDAAGQGQMTLLSHLPLSSGQHGDVWIHEQFAYVGTRCGGPGVDVVDISNPSQPRFVTSLGGHPSSSYEDVIVIRAKTQSFDGNLLAVGIQQCERDLRGSAGVQFWDVTNPERPRRLGFLGTGALTGGVHELSMIQRGNQILALLAVPFAESVGAGGDFKLVDATDPARPVHLSYWSLGQNQLSGLGRSRLKYVHSAWPSDDGRFAYLSAWDEGVIIVDISDVSTPVFVGKTAYAEGDEGNAHSVWPLGDRHLLVADEDYTTDDDRIWGQLRIYDISSPQQPRQIASFGTPVSRGLQQAPDAGWYSIHNPFVAGDRAFLSWYADGIRVLDVSNPTGPREVAFAKPVPPESMFAHTHPDHNDNKGGYLGSPTSVWGVYVSGDLVAASDIQSGLHLYRYTETAPATFSLAQNQSMNWTTNSTSPTVNVGFGKITSSGTATPHSQAVIQFRQNGTLISEAAVPVTATFLKSRLYVRNEGEIRTGVAIANPNDVTALISFYTTDRTGRSSASRSLEIPANSQLAVFADQPPFEIPAPFEGTLTLDSAVPIATTALRGVLNERGEFLITTLPVVSPDQPPRDPAAVAHFADGQGWTTELLLINPGDTAITGTISAISNSLPLADLFQGQTGTSVAYRIEARSALRLTSRNSSARVRTGSIRIATTGSSAFPQSLAVLSLKQNGITITASGVAATVASKTWTLPVNRQVNQNRDAGIALANTSADAAASVRLTLVNGSGQSSTTVTRDLPANGHLAAFLSELFPELGSFRGLLRVESDAAVVVTGLNAIINERGNFLISAASAASDSTPRGGYFPHVVDGGGYVTEFLLYAINGESSTGSLLLTSRTGQAMEAWLRRR